MGEIYAAKTNHITNPVGYALKPLVFSWKRVQRAGTAPRKDHDQQRADLYHALLRYGRGRT